MHPTLTHIVFSGGGLTGLAYLGVCRYLEVEGMMSSIQHFSGTSMGAVFATACALGLSSSIMERRFKAFFVKDANIHYHLPDVWTLSTSFGVDDGRRNLQLFEEGELNITFLELTKRTGRHLVICATHVETMSPCYFSVDTTPHVLLRDALRASVALPWVYHPVQVGTDHYIDGAVSDNFPFKPFAEVPPTQVLGVQVCNRATLPCSNVLSSPWTYTFAIMQRFIYYASAVECHAQRYPYFVRMDQAPLGMLPCTFDQGALKVSVSSLDIDHSIMYGYEKTYDIFASTQRACTS
jgi:predicted acylesterase/phospholipase RssA